MSGVKPHAVRSGPPFVGHTPMGQLTLKIGPMGYRISGPNRLYSDDSVGQRCGFMVSLNFIFYYFVEFFKG